MKYQIVEPKLHSKNRENFSFKLKKRSLAVINASDEFPRSGDQIFNFKQNPDLFYLTGIDQEQTILLLFPDCPNPLYREVLFLRQTNEHIAVWEGHKYTKERARDISGIETVLWLEEFWPIFASIVNYADTIYLNTNENDRYASSVQYRDIRFIEEIKTKYPLKLIRSAKLPVISAGVMMANFS